MPAAIQTLVTSGGGAPAVAVIKALRQQSHYPVEIGTIDMQPRSVGRMLADWFALAPGANDEAFVPFVLDLCRRQRVEYVFAIMDEELPVWAAGRQRFADEGITVFVNPLACVEAAGDKQRSAALCREHTIPHPVSYAPSRALDLAPEAFPLFAKPRFGRGSVGAQRVETQSELGAFLRRHPDGIVQDLLEGAELTVDVLIGDAGELLAAVPKERLEVKSGMATKSVTRDDPEAVEFAATVARTFGVSGAANIQMMRHRGEPHLIEVNPKFATSLPLTVAAGVNLPACLMQMARGEFVGPTPLPYRSGLVMLRCWEEHFIEERELATAGS